MTTTACDGTLPLSSLGLAVPSAAPRLRALLHRADQRFVAEVVRDGGIGPWRERLDARLLLAREALLAGRLSHAGTASFVVALTDRPTRDRCWARVEAGIETGEGSDWLPLWRHLVRHAVPPYRAEVLFLFAWTAWRQGTEASARAAVAALLAEEPAHVAGGMLAVLLHDRVGSSAVPPLVATQGALPAVAEAAP